MHASRSRVAVRPPRGTLHQAPLEPREFLHGKRRARAHRPAPSPRTESASAWQLLGLMPGADATAIKRAYRRLARSLHPDLHPEATLEERRELSARFSEVTEAYRTLVA